MKCAERPGPSTPTPPRSRRVYVLWGVALTLLLALGLFCWLVVLPVHRTRTLMHELAYGDLAPEGVIEAARGQRQAAEQLERYLRFPEWLAPCRDHPTMLSLAEHCEEHGVPALLLLTGSTDRDTRAMACLRIEELGKGSAEEVAVLQALRGDPEKCVREAAAEALKEIRAKATERAEVPPARATLCIQPMGRELPDADVAMVKRALVAFYAYEIKVLPRVELPKEAYYPPRKRYRAEKLLVFLKGRLPAGGHRILGLTGVDISTTKGKHKDWGILGLATLSGEACVISMFRAKRGARDAAHARERLAKVAVHETGHTLGLDHCPRRGCIMEDAKGKVSTSDREYDLCPDCRAKLKKGGHSFPAEPEIPWPKPKETDK